ncbi:uroporphyrinogen-III C-methyltransferase [Chryseolinea sp. H1M3-3]|uniref:uroporphyrinogen-III C-methyltransferase n=1 Tax=Chryseolinea sp. H1M3-3 TaxID=3034144 RepID=UPI0023EC5C82|nr:uroporphyrinogen-III C-methyltransferase [Chryseolinea sp. H1M3-3]
MKTISPKVWIVGAGPGDPELISVKGLKTVQRADVILYDALVSPELLEFAPAFCKKVYVGKRKGKKEFLQEEINQLIVFYATRFGCVVRLKGGDPNVFGRGHEEMEYANRRGIKVEVIPGISSALAAPSSAGIPLTKRGINESFWVITGTLSSGEISNDIALAAQSSATVIVLMGMSHLQKIAELFKTFRSPEEPVALIQEATTSNQKIAIGTAGNICQSAHAAGITSPAVIVIGKVVDENTVTNAMVVLKSRVIAED